MEWILRTFLSFLSNVPEKLIQFAMQALFDVTLHNMNYFDFTESKMETQQRHEFAFNSDIYIASHIF